MSCVFICLLLDSLWGLIWQCQMFPILQDGSRDFSYWRCVFRNLWLQTTGSACNLCCSEDITEALLLCVFSWHPFQFYADIRAPRVSYNFLTFKNNWKCETSSNLNSVLCQLSVTAEITQMHFCFPRTHWAGLPIMVNDTLVYLMTCFSFLLIY